MKKATQPSMRVRHMLEGYGFVAMWTIGFLVFMAVPLGRSLLYSLQELTINAGRLKGEFIGAEHYSFAFTVDVEFAPILFSTVREVLLNVPLILIFSMFCALLLNRPLKGRIWFRGVFFLPVILAAGSVMLRLLEQNATSLPIFQDYELYLLVDSYLPAEATAWLFRMLNSLTVVMWGSGVQILIFIAGLQTIPTSLYEAAKCDGATPWESFWKITFPMMMPMILVCALFSIVDSFTKVENAMMQYIYKLVFVKINYGYAAAAGWIYFILIFLMICLVLWLFRRTGALDQAGR